MKKIKLIISAVAIMLIGSSAINAQAKYNDAEKIARTSVQNYLIENGYPTDVDPRDESLVFETPKDNNTMYWITFEGNAMKMLYTLHRQRIDLIAKDKKEPEISRIIEVATRGAHDMSANTPLKVFVKKNRLEMEMSTYASSPKAFCEALPSMLVSFKDASSAYRKYYDNARVACDSIHKYYADIDMTRRVVAQPQRSSEMADAEQKPVAVQTVEFSSVDEDGNPVVHFGKPLQTRRMQFLLPKVIVQVAEPGEYTLYAKIKDTEGKTLLANADDDYTSIVKFQVQKKDVKSLIEVFLDSFGSTDDTFWTPGNYKIEIYQDGVKTYNQNFTVVEK